MIQSNAERAVRALGRAGVTVASFAAGMMVLGAFAQGDQRLDHDVYQPIEFTADRLDVEEKGKIATFDGNVIATQGDLRLMADTIKVFFGDPQDDGAENPDDRPSVSRIDAEGHVVLTSPSESATGNWGIYDVDHKIVTLGGAVVLTRGDTVIEGDRLEMDLELGRSKIESVSGGETGQRVRGVFRPSKPEDDNDE